MASNIRAIATIDAASIGLNPTKVVKKYNNHAPIMVNAPPPMISIIPKPIALGIVIIF